MYYEHFSRLNYITIEKYSCPYLHFYKGENIQVAGLNGFVKSHVTPNGFFS